MQLAKKYNVSNGNVYDAVKWEIPVIAFHHLHVSDYGPQKSNNSSTYFEEA
jgi:hypothetical protein